MKRKILTIIIVLFVLLLIPGCKNNIDLVGLSYYRDVGSDEVVSYEYYHFKESGVCEIEYIGWGDSPYADCEYSIEDNYLTISYNKREDKEDTYKKKYKISDDKKELIYIENEEIIFTLKDE